MTQEKSAVLTSLANTIYQWYSFMHRKTLITTDQVTEFEVAPEKYQDAVTDIKCRLKIKIKTGLCSSLLMGQLARHKCGLGEVFYNQKTGKGKVEYLHSSEILETIESLETRDVKNDVFRHDPLSGLFKIHHSPYCSRGYSIIRNIATHWFDRAGNILAKRQQDFERIAHECAYNCRAVANTMHTTAMGKKNLTGEWLIYAIHDSRKYYLCLAAHEEGDEFIYEHKIKRCYQEFPELEFATTLKSQTNIS